MTSFNLYIKLFDKKIFIVLLGLILILFSNFIGHFAASFSIIITPILLPIIIGGLNFSLYKITYYLTVVYGFGLLLLNDFLIRLYSGGINDDAGKGWTMLIFIIAFVIASLTMAAFAFTSNKQSDKRRKIVIVVSKIIFLFIIAVSAGLFYDRYLSRF